MQEAMITFFFSLFYHAFKCTFVYLLFFSLFSFPSFSPSLLPPFFGQRPRRGRSPVEHRVCPFVCSSYGCGSGRFSCRFHRFHFRFRFHFAVQILVAIPPTKMEAVNRLLIPINYTQKMKQKQQKEKQQQ